MNTIETQLEFGFMKPDSLTSNLDKNYKFVYDAYTTNTNSFLVNSSLYVPPAYTVQFYKEGKPIGTLSWKDGPMKFEGDVEYSAQLFFDNVIKRYAQSQLDLVNYNGRKS
jgi:hypothetical protein